MCNLKSIREIPDPNDSVIRMNSETEIRGFSILNNFMGIQLELEVLLSFKGEITAETSDGVVDDRKNSLAKVLLNS